MYCGGGDLLLWPAAGWAVIAGPRGETAELQVQTRTTIGNILRSFDIRAKNPPFVQSMDFTHFSILCSWVLSITKSAKVHDLHRKILCRIKV
jgi:hypothetical protein